MKIFIYTLVVTGVLQFLTAHLCSNFRGSSKAFFNYLNVCTGIGGFATIALFIWACFLTTWWIPIAAYGVRFIIQTITPPIPILEVIASWLFPISFITTVILLILNI